MPQFDSFNKVDIVPGAKFERRSGRGTSTSLCDTTPADVTDTPTAGTSTEASRCDHAHEGVHSVSKSGDTALFGDVTVTGSGGITVTQTGQNIDFDGSGSGSSKGYIQLPFSEAVLTSTDGVHLTTWAAGKQFRYLHLTYNNDLSYAEWVVSLRNNVAAIPNLRLGVTWLFLNPGANKDHHVNLYFKAAASGTNLTTINYGAPTLLTFAETGNKTILNTTYALTDDGGFADSTLFFIRIEKDTGTVTPFDSTQPLGLVGAYLNFDTD